MRFFAILATICAATVGTTSGIDGSSVKDYDATNPHVYETTNKLQVIIVQGVHVVCGTTCSQLSRMIMLVAAHSSQKTSIV